MATTFEFTISCPKEDSARAQSVLASAHRLTENLENELTEFRPQSPVYRLNHSAVGERIAFTRHGMECLAVSENLKVTTRGAFSHMAKSTRPSASIEIDKASNTVWRDDPGAHLGFGAVGKGYALDQVRGLIELAGFRDYRLVAGGSSIVLSGFAGPGDPWKWGWSWKKDQTGADLGIAFAHNTGDPIAIGVSGTHEKGFHVLDPRTGQPARALESALIGHSSAAMADGLSTALFVSGWDEANRSFADVLLPPAAATVDREEVPRWNGIFQRYFGAISEAVAGSGAITLALFAFGIFAQTVARADDGAVDLNDMGANAFTPYVLDRSPWWALLPVFTLVVILSHLRDMRKNK